MTSGKFDEFEEQLNYRQNLQNLKNNYPQENLKFNVNILVIKL